MVKVLDCPYSTVCGVAGVMAPLAPALGVIVKVSTAKVALIVWSACTLVNV